MLRSSLALLCLFLVSSVQAASELKFPLVGFGWQITFEGPELKKASLDYTEESIQYKGNSGLFNMSLFVEPPPGEAKESSHSACRQYYWSQGKRNPMIDVESVKLSTLDRCEIVEYTIEGDFQGEHFTQGNINCYFVHEGKWVDLHVSYVQPTPADTAMLKKLAVSLAYGPLETTQGKRETIKLPDVGSVSITPPAGWIMSNVLADDISVKEVTQYTVSFMSATNPNANCMLSIGKVPDPPKDRDALHQAVKSATKVVAESTVEKDAKIQDLKLKGGIGAVAAFTDASLVGKPKEAGNTKALINGMIVPKPGVLSVVSIFTDDVKGDEAAKMLEAVESLTVE